MAMTFDGSVGLGTIVEIGVTIIGAVGVWFTSRERLNQLWKRAEAQEKQHDENQKKFADIELQIARDCVKNDAFLRLEDRLSGKIEKLEHSVNNATAKAVGEIRGMLRDVLPTRARRGSQE